MDGVGTAVVVVVARVVGGAAEDDEAVAWGFAPSLEQLTSTSTATTPATLRAIRATLPSDP